MVLAGGASQRFPPDKLAQLVDGQPLLDRTLASLPEDFVVVVVGPGRQVARPVNFAGIAARALMAAAGPGGAAGVSARRLLDALRPGLVSQELAPAELWDIDTPDQLIAWRLRSSPAVSSILDLAIEGRPGAERPVVIAIDGPGCGGKSILATALGLRSEGSVLEGSAARRISSAPSVLPRALTFAWTIKIYATEAMCKCSQSPYRVEM